MKDQTRLKLERLILLITRLLKLGKVTLQKIVSLEEGMNVGFVVIDGLPCS